MAHDNKGNVSVLKSPVRHTMARRLCDGCGCGIWNLETSEQDPLIHILICASCGDTVEFTGMLSGDEGDIEP